jgi:hypothetical protein
LSLTLDNQHVFFTAFVGSGGEVASFDADGDAGAAATSLSSSPETANPGAIATDGTNAYWTNTSPAGVYSCPIAGCGTNTPTTILDKVYVTLPSGLAVDSTFLYVTDEATGAVLQCSLTNGCGAGPTSVASMQSGAKRIVADDAGVAWATSDSIVLLVK